MSFHLQDNPRPGNALLNAPLILSWTLGILVGLSYLVLPGYVFGALFALFLLIMVIFKNYSYGYYLVMLFLPVDMSHLAITLKTYSAYRVLFFPYLVPLSFAYVAWFASKLWSHEQQRKTAPIEGILVLMVTYLCISLIWAPHRDLGALLAITLVLNFLVFFLTRDVITDDVTLRKAAFAWIMMGVVTATGVIVSQWYSYKAIEQISETTSLVINFGEIHSRPAGFGSENDMGGLLVSGVFITIGMFMSSRGLAKRLFIASLISYQFIALILTVSRGSLIGFFAGLILLLIVHPSAKNKIIRYFFLSFILVGLLILIAKPGYIDRLLIGFGYTGELYFSNTQTSYSGNTDVSKVDVSGLAGRIKMWKTGFQEMLNHPYKLILGLGMGGFITYSGQVYTHSVPFSFYFDLGVIGVIVFIILAIILFSQFSRYLRLARRTDSYYIFMTAVVAFVAEIGVHGLIDYDFYSYPSRMFWFPLAYVCAALNVMIWENPELGKGGSQ
jgi:hypothetical protein